MPRSAVPSLRVRRANDRPVRADGGFVLYWMTAHRRVGWNFALDRALEWVRELGKPLVILEAQRAGDPWASDRLHRFVLLTPRAGSAAPASPTIRTSSRRATPVMASSAPWAPRPPWV
jgi:deoxyribodipyrimidine photo-lyase